jgi:hypothetical protein
LTGSREA